MSKLNWRSMIAVLSDLTEERTKGRAGRGVEDTQAASHRPAAASAVLCDADGAGACRDYEGLKK
jgi:hypothetical protein